MILEGRLHDAPSPLLDGPNSSSSVLCYIKWFERHCVQGYLPELSGPSTSLFPSVLPYPETIRSGCDETGEHSIRTWWSKRFVNTLVCWGNFVTMGCPEVGDNYEPQGGYRCLRDIRVVADELLGEVIEFASEELLSGALGCEGKRVAIEKLLSQVRCTVGACYGGLPDVGVLEAGGPTLPVRASRIAVPEVAGKVDPCLWLDPDKAEVVRNLAALRRPEHQWEDIVRAFHQVPEDEEARVAERLLETGMAELVPEAELPADSRGKLLTGGLFCVPKNEGEDRLIFDRRPENATMHRLRWASLPSGACFTKLLLGEDEFLRASGDDLRNYYYMLRLPPGWVRYNSVGRRVDPKVVARWHGDPKVPYRLAFRVLGMGDKNGCDIAQATHEAILRRHGVLDPSSTLEFGKHIPEGELLEGVYLDDLLIAKRCKVRGRVPLDGSFVPPPAQVDDMDVKKIEAAEAAYIEAQLSRAEHKSFRFCTAFKAWGAEIDGIRGKAGSPLSARRQVWVLIEKILARGWASQDVLRQVVGYLSYMFQYRRELYCLQHHLHKFIARMPAKKWVRLPGHICDELRACGLHLPFACWNMRRKLSETLFATDATPTSGGSVRAAISPKLAKALWRHTEVKSDPVRLDRDDAFELTAELPKEPSQFVSVVSQCLEWRVVRGYTTRQTSHINLQECRALRKQLIEIAADPANHNKIQLLLNDSRVVIGALTKGRSSSFRLNGILRALLPHLLFGRLGLGMLWVEAEANLADHPSRFNPIPPPRPCPLWLQRLGVATSKPQVGLEVTAGVSGLTQGLRKHGCRMLDPLDFAGDLAYCNKWLRKAIASKRFSWLWISPPGAGRMDDSWGPNGGPHGAHPLLLWMRLLELVGLAVEAGVFVFFVHPNQSSSWRLRKSLMFLKHDSLKSFVVDLNAFVKEPLHYPVALRIVTSAPWFNAVTQYRSGLVGRGCAAEEAGFYPALFCKVLADAISRWEASAFTPTIGAHC